MNRRDFLKSTAATLAAAPVLRAQGKSESAKLERISLMTLAWENFLKVPGYNQKTDNSLDILDVPEMFADRYGIHSIEFQYTHVPVNDPATLNELMARVKKAHSRVRQINVEHSETISSPEQEKRDFIVNFQKQWIDHAAAIGCPRIMIYQGPDLTTDKLTYTIPTLKSVADYARSKNIKLCMETRSRPPQYRNAQNLKVPYGPDVQPPPPAWVKDDATRAAWLAGKPFVIPGNPTPASPPASWTPPNGGNLLLQQLAKETGTYLNIDVGGMAVETNQDMEDGIRKLLPLTSGSVHINWRGNPGWDLPTVIRQFAKLGYKGQYTIESNQNPDAYQIVAGLREVLLANI